MKVLFINYLDIAGGAAIAAWRLAGSLEKYCGTENHFLVATKKSDANHVHAVTPVKKVPRLIDAYIVKYSNSMGLQYVWIPFASRNILESAKRIRPDVISLHNLHGGYFALPLLKKLSALAPIVWTLHDMWSFSRNAAYTFGNDAWKVLKSFDLEKTIHPSIGLDTGNLLLRIKKKIYAQSNLSIVAPSKWLYDLTMVAPVFKDKKKSMIPYVIDTKVFRPDSKSTARTRLQLPVDGKWIMFDSNWIHHDPRKGGGNLLRILMRLNEKTKERIRCLVLGSNVTDELSRLKNLDFHVKGHVSNERQMAVFYNAADLVIFPSQADNLPNVLIEATACGTPCVAFDVGGVGDIIVDGVTGYRVPPFDNDMFTDKILNILDNQTALFELSQSSAEFAAHRFDSKKIGETYFLLFQAAMTGSIVS
jgi:glycosyltransferase involved in cell wall biosynthesis